MLISRTCAELYGRLENIKLFSCRKCTRVASAHVCVCNQTVPEYIVLLRYFFTAAEKISKFETCGLTVSVVWSCRWHNRFNVTWQFTEKKFVRDKTSPIAHKNLAELYGRLENIKLFSCQKCTRVAGAHVCVCNLTVPEYIMLLRYFFTAAEKISKFETCGLTVSVVWSCWWRNRFNVTGQFTEKKLVQDKSSPLAHKNLRELHMRDV